MKEIPFNELANSPLLVDAIYKGGRRGNAGDDPLGPLLRLSNSGGFRYRGNLNRLDMVALTTTFSEQDWPDALDRESGIFTYYGDNRRPGHALHETPRKGNALLARIFEDAQSGIDGRRQTPPTLLFASTGRWRDLEFLGLAVPGTGISHGAEDLVAIWRTANGRRFQNYRARFTVLDTGTVSRDWLNSLIEGRNAINLAPLPWRDWVETGRLTPLVSPRTTEHRSKSEQMPSDAEGRAMITAIHQAFSGRPHDFELCAARLLQFMLPDIAALDHTRTSRDGGRDAVGKLRIGVGPGAILADFSMEAKCYGPENSVGVREISRLISRLRHRQFGVIVTTSWVDTQAYREIKEDQHPILVMSAADIVATLKTRGFLSLTAVQQWLEVEFPP